MANPHVLVVEDDADLRRLLRRGLDEDGFEVVAVARGAEAIDAVARREPDALVLDIGLPDADGRDVCQALRARGLDAPVVFLTARDALVDRLAGFRAGGDDYVTKPFHFDELVARLHALLRRAGADADADAAGAITGLRLDPIAHAVSAGEREIRLTATEFRLLAALLSRPGAVIRRPDLVRAASPGGAARHA